MYTYDAVHNTIKHVEDTEDAFDDAIDERGILKPGKRVRVPFMMRDSSSPTPGAKMWHGESIPIHDSDPPKKDGKDSSRQEMNDARRKSAMDRAVYNLDISNRWRGGISALDAGDIVTLGGQQFVVASYEDDKLVIRDANPGRVKQEFYDANTMSDAERAKQAAYDSYDAEIQNAWRR